jgi:UDP-2,4-diacetamido-2,4,6-trideoxy-beta-L-altropyranose hydrolase
MQVLIRVDASHTIGTGHVMRCLTLANVLKAKGVEIIFVCREHKGHLCVYLEEQGFSVSRLTNDDKKRSKVKIANVPEHAAWLNTSWQNDAEQTCGIIDALDIKPDWIIVDHYALDYRWETVLRDKIKKLMVIDDLAGRQHNCDILLDQNLIVDYLTRYKDKVSSDSRLMLGTEYALLQPDYMELHDRIPPRSGQVKRLLVFFGGADIENLTGQVTNIFRRIDRMDIHLDVVLTSNNPYKDTLCQQVKDIENIHIYSGLSTLAPLMAKADLAIGASGATSWERCCLGLPSLVISLAENQIPIAKEMHRSGLIKWLGHKDEIDQNIIEGALRDIIDKGLDNDWSVKCKMIVDGMGAYRVCNVMLIGADTKLRARHARPDDEIFLMKWKGYMDETSDEMHSWFYECLRNPGSFQLYIIETEENIQIGYICFRLVNGVWNLDYKLAKVYKDREIDQKLLIAGISKLRIEKNDRIFFGNISNSTSINVQSIEPIELNIIDKKNPKYSIGICSDTDSWINLYIPQLVIGWMEKGHKVSWVHDANDFTKGDMSFYLSYGSIVNKDVLNLFRNNLVVHESGLPRGKGWSPLTWQVLEGASTIPITLFEAEENVDSGVIYLQRNIELKGDELVDDLRQAQVEATISLCCSFVDDYPNVTYKPQTQSGEVSYYSRRYPKDSKIDIDRTIRSQFNIFRVSDNKRYPVWFETDNTLYTLQIDKK